MTVDLLSRQVLVAGRVTDAITGSTLRAAPRITLVRANDGAAIAGVAISAHDDGWFAVHGDPRRLPAAQPIVLRLMVAADGYAPASRDIPLSAADLARVVQPIAVAGASAVVDVVAAAPFPASVALSPLPVALAGRVARAEDPTRPVVGATITVTAPSPVAPVTSDGEGRFRIGPLPVAASVDIEIAAADRTTFAGSVRPDFRIPINQQSFTLEQI